MKILYCDDKPDDRKDWQENILTAWEMLKTKDVKIIAEDLMLETCSDISLNHCTIPDARCVKDLGGFDGFLLDIYWDSKTSDPVPHGIDIAEILRKNFPEKPIMMFTIASDPILFNRLIGIDICGYLSKKETYDTLCLQIVESMGRALQVRGGQCLYKHLRQLSANNTWSCDSVSTAASETWKLERSHDRWDAFWKSFEKPISEYRLTTPFANMLEFFKEADLLLLGTLPGMRGHLDHVLNVYFTGYVISNINSRFRSAAIAAAKRLFPDKCADISKNEEYYWGLFQLSWLAAATLHDTAYPLEILPDLMCKCREISSHFKAILKEEKVSSIQKKAPSLEFIEEGISNIATFIVKLRDNNLFTFLKENSTFEKDGVKRINHGVASGLLFMSHAKNSLMQKETPPELETYLMWAATAMSLHSLKIPGSKAKINLSLEKDPLSYLLMICDEIQVWERERPDTSKMKSPFKSTDLVDFKVTQSNIDATVNYALYNGTEISKQFDDFRKQLNISIEHDGTILGKYIDGCGLKVCIKQTVSSEDVVFSPLNF